MKSLCFLAGSDSTHWRAVVWASFMMLLPMSLSAAKPLPTEIVEVTGVGETRGAARQDAYRAAVEKVVGSYVKADLITENDDIIKDEVLGLSAGFIDSAEVLSEGKRGDRLYEIRLKATVVVQKVVRQLEAMNISVVPVNSENLFAEASTKMNQRDATQAIWGKFWNGGGWWKRAFDLTVEGSPVVVPLLSGEEVYAVLRVSAKLNSDFASELESNIRGASIEVLEGTMREITSGYADEQQKLERQGRQKICVARVDPSDKRSARAIPKEEDFFVANIGVGRDNVLTSRFVRGNFEGWKAPYSFDFFPRASRGICGVVEGVQVKGPREGNPWVVQAALEDENGVDIATGTGELIGYDENFSIVHGLSFFRDESNTRWIGVRLKGDDLMRVKNVDLSVQPHLGTPGLTPTK